MSALLPCAERGGAEALTWSRHSFQLIGVEARSFGIIGVERHAHTVHLGGSPARVWDSFLEEAVLTQSERKNRNEADEEEREGCSR